MKEFDCATTYKIVDGLTVSANAVKACIFNGTRTYHRHLERGTLKTATDIAEVLKPHINTVLSEVQGTHPDKDNILEKLEWYLITKIVDSHHVNIIN